MFLYSNGMIHKLKPITAYNLMLYQTAKMEINPDHYVTV